MIVNFLRDGERRIIISEILFHFFGDCRAERCAVAVRRTLFCRAVTDFGCDDNERRLFGFFLGFSDSLVDGVDVLAVRDFNNLPALRLVAFAHVLGERDVGVALDRDMVAVVKNDEFAEFPRSGKRSRFALDALHHTAVAAKRVGVMIDEFYIVLIKARREHAFRNRESYRVGDTLSERTCGSFDAHGVTVFGVTGGKRSYLTERFEVVHRESVPEKMKKRVK